METKKIDTSLYFISALKHSCTSRLDDFREYVFELERKFEGDLKKIEKRYDDAISEEDDEYRTYLAEIYSDEHYQVDKIFRRILRYSVLVSLYTLLEDRLVFICKKIERQKQLAKSFDKYQKKGEGSTIAKARNYLLEIASVPAGSLDASWNHLQDLNVIRNCIAHSGGDATKVPTPKAMPDGSRKETIQETVKRMDSVTIENDRFIVLPEEYIENTITHIGTFLSAVITASYCSEKKP